MPYGGRARFQGVGRSHSTGEAGEQSRPEGGGVGRDFGARASLPALGSVEVQFGDVNGQAQLRDFGQGPVYLIESGGGDIEVGLRADPRGSAPSVPVAT